MKTILTLAILFSMQVFARPEISIPARVEISQRPLLRLGDIAEVRGGTEELVAVLDSVVLREDSRDLLLSQHLESGEILSAMRRALDAQSNLKRLNPQFRVPSRVEVTFAPVPVSREEVLRKIQNVLKARCQDCEYQVSIQSTPRPASRNWELDFTQLSVKGGFLLPLRDGDSGQIKWISGTIRVSRLTPVTTRMILQGERVQVDDLRMSLIDVTFAKDGNLRIEDIQGQAVSRSLPIGSPVWASDLKREPAAKRGQIVKALFGDESFEISVNMIAEDSGFVGDLIKVKNLETQKVLSGLVTDKGVVRLQ